MKDTRLPPRGAASSAVLRFVVLCCAAFTAVTSPAGAGRPPEAAARIRERFGASQYTERRLPLPADLPDAFDIDVEHGGRVRRLALWRHSARGSGYILRIFRDGRFYDCDPGPARTYQGVVADEPDSAVAALLDEQGLSLTVYVAGRPAWHLRPLAKALPGAARSEHALIDESDMIPPVGMCGVELTGDELQIAPAANLHTLNDLANVGDLFDTGGNSSDEPGEPLPAVRNHLRVAQIAFDVDNKVYLDYGSSLEAVQNRVDEIVNTISVIYARDALINYELTGCIVRKTKFYDYENNNQGTSLDEFRNKWEARTAGNAGITYDVAHMITGNNSGGILGLAWVTEICSGWAYGWSDDIAGVVAHEIGHNWGLGHCDGNGDCHIMCSGYGGCEGNPTFFGDLYALQLRASGDTQGCLTNAGAFAQQVPPRAFRDDVTIGIEQLLAQGDLTIDVLANDHDANFEALVLTSVDAQSPLGAALTQVNGKILYTPAPGGAAGVDTFNYACRDTQGNEDTGAVVIDVAYNHLIAQYKLDDTTGTSAADSAGGRFGTLNGGMTFDAQSTEGRFGRALLFDGADDHVDIPPLNLNSDTMTITAWIKWDGTQNERAGIVMSRDASTVAGLGMRASGELSYHWNDATATWNWSSGLIPPADKWVFVALTVRPERANVYYYDGTLYRAVNEVPHGIEEFDGVTCIGYDSLDSKRHFEGAIDEVRIYNYVLGPRAIEAVAQGGPPVSPRPHHYAGAVSTQARLYWDGAPNAGRYDIYFGTDYNAVAAATFDSPEFKGRRTPADFNPVLDKDRTYFWRVDEVLTDATRLTGETWRFTTGGSITRKVWLDMGAGNYVSDLINSPRYPNDPDFVDYLTAFEAPTNWADRYGTCIQGSLQPQTTGNYTFWIAGDDYCQLWLSTDENPAHLVQIASVSGATNPREWTKYPGQQSAAIRLEGGRKYSILALHKEGVGNDNVAVAWQGPDSPSRTVIQGRWLWPIPANEMPLFDHFFTDKPDAAEAADYTASLAADVRDPDGGTPAFIKVAGPDWLVVASDGALTGRPEAGDTGDNYFQFRARDAFGEYADGIVKVRVHDTFSGVAGLNDLLGLAAKWLAVDCTDVPPCGGADLNLDGRVDIVDFARQSGDWLAVSEPDLIANWTMDDTWGTIVRDQHGAFDGVLVNTDEGARQPGRCGSALSFDGKDDYVQITGYKGITGPRSRTTAAWINTAAVDPQVLLAWGDFGPGGRWQLTTDAEGRLRLETGGGACVGTADLCNGRWRHVAAVLDNDGTPDLSEVKLYVDGVEDPLSSTGPLPLDTLQGVDVAIGMSLLVQRPFQGLIDEVRVYGAALNAPDVRRLMLETDGFLVGCWDFDETAGAVAHDLGRNGFHGTLLNMNENAWTEGRSGGALAFDGLDDSVVIAGCRGPGGGSSRTVLAWIRTTDTTGPIVAWGLHGVTGRRWVVSTEAAGRLGVAVGGAGIIGSTPVCDDNWHHVAVVLEDDGSPNLNEVKLYVDGQPDTPSAAPDMLVDTGTGAHAALDITIGAYPPTATFFHGQIDELRIYASAMTPDEIAVMAR